MIPALVDLPLFKDLAITSINDIVAFSRLHHFLPGDIIIAENDSNNHDLYILSEGNVEITSNSSKITSGEVVLSKKDFEVFGEISWMTRAKRTATVRCVGEAEVVQIDGDKLWEYLQSHPQTGYLVMRNLSTILSERLGNTDVLLKQLLLNSGV